jgi:hypothetical protein
MLTNLLTICSDRHAFDVARTLQTTQESIRHYAFFP